MGNKLKPVKILSAIRPQEKDGQLVSPGVENEIKRHEGSEALAWKKLLEAPEGSPAEEKAAHWLARRNLLEAASQLAAPDADRNDMRRDMWAQRFTESSSELYAPPELYFVRRIIREEIAELSSTSGEYIDRVYSFYLALAERIPEVDGAHGTRMQCLRDVDYRRLGKAFIERNRDWFEYLETHQQEAYRPRAMAEVFEDLISLRGETDPDWKAWEVELTPKKDTVSVIGSKSRISVGKRRAAATHEDLKGLVAHEFGVHATRTINGGKVHRSLKKGLKGYLDTEEGLGVLAERFVTGRMPDKAKDRYVDIALAMGLIRGVQLSRRELMKLALDRSLARCELRHGQVDEDLISREAKKAKTHVNRIFRGGDGQDGGSPAVFTKDAIYYPAHLEDYIARMLDKGARPERILDFLLQGKFDPTNTMHKKKLVKYAKHNEGVIINPLK